MQRPILKGSLDVVVATHMLVVNKDIGYGPLSRLGKKNLLHEYSVNIMVQLQDLDLDAWYGLEDFLGGVTVRAVALGVNDDLVLGVLFVNELGNGGSVDHVVSFGFVGLALLCFVLFYCWYCETKEKE